MEKKILQPKFRFDGSPNDDTQIRVGLETEQNILKNDDRTVVLNLSQQYFDEKNNCDKYKIFGKLRMVFRNLYSGEAKYPYLREKLSLLPIDPNPLWLGYLPYDEFAFRRMDVNREVNTGTTISDLDNFTGFTLTKIGDDRHQEITTLDAPYHNWNFYLSYVYTGDTKFPMKYTLSGSPNPTISFLSGSGIVFRVQTGNTSYILTSPVPHGMNQGEYIIINGRTYYINSVGNEIYDSEKYVLTLNKSQFSGVTLNTLITGKRCLDNKNVTGTTSQYYVHKHKTLTEYNECIIDNIGFESPIFEDEKKIIYENSVRQKDVIVERNRMESLFYYFKNPFILSGLTNNLGFTPNEIYVTSIFRNGSGYFLYPPKIGYSFNFHDSWVDLHFNGTVVNEQSISGTSFTRYDGTFYHFMSGNTLPIGTSLYGAFVEYIPSEMKERVISESIHKFITNPLIFDHGQTGGTTYSGATINNPIGLYYQPHYRIKLRELSSYVETSSTNNVINLPDNAKYYPNENVWKWRDVYDLGYFDEEGNGVDFTYMNDMLYVHKNINFYLKNEKQFNNKQDGVKKFKNLSSTSLSSIINC